MIQHNIYNKVSIIIYTYTISFHYIFLFSPYSQFTCTFFLVPETDYSNIGFLEIQAFVDINFERFYFIKINK